MSSLRGNFHKVFKDFSINHGYTKHKDVYFRITNDLYQSFIFLQDYDDPHCFTIGIDFAPLCIGIDKDYLQPGSELRITDILNSKDIWFRYDDELTNAKEDVILYAYQLFESKVYKVYEDMIDTYKLYNYIKYDANGEIFSRDKAVYVYMKCEDYIGAKSITREILNKAYETININIKEFKFSAYEASEYRKRIEERLQPILLINRYLENEDYEPIKSLIHNNEEYSRSILDGIIRESH